MDKTARHNFDHSAKKPFHFLISKNGEDFNFFLIKWKVLVVVLMDWLDKRNEICGSKTTIFSCAKWKNGCY